MCWSKTNLTWREMWNWESQRLWLQKLFRRIREKFESYTQMYPSLEWQASNRRYCELLGWIILRNCSTVKDSVKGSTLRWTYRVPQFDIPWRKWRQESLLVRCNNKNVGSLRSGGNRKTSWPHLKYLWKSTSPKGTPEISLCCLSKKAPCTRMFRSPTKSLMSHVLKILINIVLERIRANICSEIPDVQFGFVSGRGTRNSIFLHKMINDDSILYQQDVYVCFIVYKKAFDRVSLAYLFQMLETVHTDNDQHILKAIYYHQEVAKHNSHLSNWHRIEHGVLQGLPIPLTFSISMANLSSMS